MNRRIDLHIHTNNSDGVLSSREVVDFCIKNNINTISITDHDCINAYSKELIDYAKNNNINLIYGTEISSKLNGISVHILGYNFDINNKQFIDELNKAKNSRIKYFNEVTNKLNKLGFILRYNELIKLETITKAHISNDIISNKDNHDKLIEYFNHIPNCGEFIEAILNKGCIAYVEKKSLTPKEASNIIKKSGGKVVLAHPVVYEHEYNLSKETIKNIIKDINADGIESNYIYVDTKNNVINDSEKWNKIAKELNVFSTIGSDYHCSDNIRPEIGLINTSLKMNEETINELIINIKS